MFFRGIASGMGPMRLQNIGEQRRAKANKGEQRQVCVPKLCGWSNIRQFDHPDHLGEILVKEKLLWPCFWSRLPLEWFQCASNRNSNIQQRLNVLWIPCSKYLLCKLCFSRSQVHQHQVLVPKHSQMTVKSRTKQKMENRSCNQKSARRRWSHATMQGCTM